VILYHANGEAFILDSAVWRSALESAMAAGWKPQGTLPPPTDLERPPALWHGAYEPAAGQQVVRPDALALASALWRALAADRHLGHQLHLLAEFCRCGGFIICSSPGISDSLTILAAHVGTSAELPSALPVADPSPRPRPGGQGASSQP